MNVMDESAGSIAHINIGYRAFYANKCSAIFHSVIKC